MRKMIARSRKLAWDPSKSPRVPSPEVREENDARKIIRAGIKESLKTLFNVSSTTDSGLKITGGKNSVFEVAIAFSPLDNGETTHCALSKEGKVIQLCSFGEYDYANYPALVGDVATWVTGSLFLLAENDVDKELEKNITAAKDYRHKGETQQDCVSRKISQIMGEKNVAHEQAIAMAISMCKKAGCKIDDHRIAVATSEGLAKVAFAMVKIAGVRIKTAERFRDIVRRARGKLLGAISILIVADEVKGNMAAEQKVGYATLSLVAEFNDMVKRIERLL